MLRTKLIKDQREWEKYRLHLEEVDGVGSNMHSVREPNEYPVLVITLVQSMVPDAAGEYMKEAVHQFITRHQIRQLYGRTYHT